jgi:hypothetical protein
VYAKKAVKDLRQLNTKIILLLININPKFLSIFMGEIKKYIELKTNHIDRVDS